ncbi:ATP-binding protein [Desulfurivibrio alkaliphilus]|uniref:ATP-binding protein n=1 Tax=Desulfurivibrio alkaliphilus TaxID=427923 RepID=UPI0002D831B7|nr:DUF234 domain-containing protein [Desulfurivibrio alkaliphilus]
MQRQALGVEIGRLVPGFGEVQYPSWEVFFNAAANQLPAGATLVLDEFPYLVQNAPELPSVMQKLLDSRRSRFHLIICGSSQRMMQGLVLDSTAPLYGRAREILKIRPLEPGWLTEALALPPEEAVAAYSVWGGVPRYWELARDFPDSASACHELVLDRNGVLHEEPMRLLLDDMRGAGQPHSLLALIAGGANRLSELGGRLGKPATSLTRPLFNLAQLGYIKREIPFGENPRSSKKSLYRLADPFLGFWYRVVQPYRSMLEQDLITEVWDATGQQRQALVAETWEELARYSVARLTIGGKRWKPASRWWGKAGKGGEMEIDVVAESLDGTAILLGEAKWEKKTRVRPLLETLRQKAAKFPRTQGKEIITAIWCKEMELAGDTGGNVLIGPEEVMAALR